MLDTITISKNRFTKLKNCVFGYLGKILVGKLTIFTLARKVNDTLKEAEPTLDLDLKKVESGKRRGRRGGEQVYTKGSNNFALFYFRSGYIL